MVPAARSPRKEKKRMWPIWLCLATSKISRTVSAEGVLLSWLRLLRPRRFDKNLSYHLSLRTVQDPNKKEDCAAVAVRKV